MSHIPPSRPKTLAEAVRAIGRPPAEVHEPSSSAPGAAVATAAAAAFVRPSTAEEARQALARKIALQQVASGLDLKRGVIDRRKVAATALPVLLPSLRPPKGPPILHDPQVFKGIERFLSSSDYMVLSMVSRPIRALALEWEKEFDAISAVLQNSLKPGSQLPDTSNVSEQLFYQRWYACLVKQAANTEWKTMRPSRTQECFFRALSSAVDIKVSQDALMKLLTTSPESGPEGQPRHKARVLMLIHGQNPALVKDCFTAWAWGFFEETVRQITMEDTISFNEWLSGGHEERIEEFIANDKFKPFRDFLSLFSAIFTELVCLGYKDLIKCLWDTHTVDNETHRAIFERLLEKQWASTKEPGTLFALLALMPLAERRRLLPGFLVHQDYVKRYADSILPSFLAALSPLPWSRAEGDEPFRNAHLAYTMAVQRSAYPKRDFMRLSPATSREIFPFSLWAQPEFLAYCTSSVVDRGDIRRYDQVWQSLFWYLERIPEDERYMQCMVALINLSYLCSDAMRTRIMTKAFEAIYHSSLRMYDPEDRGSRIASRSHLVTEFCETVCLGRPPSFRDRLLNNSNWQLFGGLRDIPATFVQNKEIFDNVRRVASFDSCVNTALLSCLAVLLALLLSTAISGDPLKKGK